MPETKDGGWILDCSDGGILERFRKIAREGAAKRRKEKRKANDQKTKDPKKGGARNG